MARSHEVSGAGDGLAVKGYCGSGSALLAFDLDPKAAAGLAGFAVERTAPDGKSSYLPNRLSLTRGVKATTTPAQRVWSPSNQAPFQKFRWVDFPPHVVPGAYKYEVTAMYFDKGTALKAGPHASVQLELLPARAPNFEIGFTRGYLSSQAYAEQFKNAPVRPTPKSLDFDTAPFEKQYCWLGFHARDMLFRFVKECLDDPSVTVDLFAYDLDEPDFVRAMQRLGPRLRAFLDNAPLHAEKGALEIQAAELLRKSAGEANVIQGHFKRFAHDKVLIQKKNGKPVKVLTGSANFSVRGLYVQANNVLVFDDPATAALYEQAFEQSFTGPSQFAKSAIAGKWFDRSGEGLPKFSVAFSPHSSAEVSLSRVSGAIEKARGSILFAVMELSGGGDVMSALRDLRSKGKVFSYGVTQNLSGDMKLYKPGSSRGILTPFAFLKGKVPAPFQKEFNGGPGQVIHHKFVVVDFNGANPLVFTGSSNLADGGEVSNGDNLLAISDASVAAAYAVEAIRLVDHYHFRAAMQSATDTALTLDTTDKWSKSYYDPKDVKYAERVLFAGTGTAAARA